MPPRFNEKDKIKILLWCNRHCCLCGKACGTDIIIHHVKQKGEHLSDIDNAIPLCLECHSKIAAYDPKHRWGTKYKIKEIKARRDQIYDTYTQHLVPIVNFSVTQVVRNDVTLPHRKFPSVGTVLVHAGRPSLPVKARIEVKHILRGKDLGIMEDPKGYYSGKTEWSLNPGIRTFGNFTVPRQCVENTGDLKIEARVTIIDQYDREHKLLPGCWTYVRKDNYWFLEPRSFTKWT